MRSFLLHALAISLALPAVSACVIVPGDVPEKQYTATFLDSASVPGPVLVRGDSTVDTIPDLITAIQPLAVPRVGIVGFKHDPFGVITGGFRYDPEKRRVHDVELPPDLVRESWPALSPDGRHVAYVGRVGEGQVRAVVRVWPRGRIVVAGPPIHPRRHDANAARWSSPDSFAVLIEVGRAPETFLVFNGTLSAGITSVDTAEVERG